MITRKEFDLLLEEHDNAVMSAILRAERERPKADYDEACTRVIRTADALWAAIERAPLKDKQ